MLSDLLVVLIQLSRSMQNPTQLFELLGFIVGGSEGFGTATIIPFDLGMAFRVQNQLLSIAVLEFKLEESVRVRGVGVGAKLTILNSEDILELADMVVRRH